jgi:hypothetical protein
MATKQIELNKALDGQGCLGRAHPDEPVFILRGQDFHASYAVRCWAEAAAVLLGFDHPKVAEALQCARAMEQWPNRKMPD